MFSMKSRIDEHADMICKMQDDQELLAGMNTVANRIVAMYQSGGKLLICGNGGSAADAQHIAGELISRFFIERPGLSAEALSSNIASITAVGNDYAYEKIFQRQIEANGHHGDVLIALSTSGESKNIVLAIEEAKRKKIVAIGITGSNRQCALATASDYSLHIPSKSTPRIQEGYLLVCHSLCEYIEAALFS